MREEKKLEGVGRRLSTASSTGESDFAKLGAVLDQTLKVLDESSRLTHMLCARERRELRVGDPDGSACDASAV